MASNWRDSAILTHDGRKVESTGYPDELESAGIRAVCGKCLHGSVHEPLDNGFIEARCDERDAEASDPQIALDNANRVHAASISGALALTPRSP